jgi:16S rRNA G966 N2-methylase RsmD
LPKQVNVTQKTRSNFFTWRGQFTPQFVDYVLECFAKPGCVIADPFSGSGTVLLEGARRNLRSYGLELNPAAYYMSGFYEATNYDEHYRQLIFNSVQSKAIQIAAEMPDLPLKIDSTDYREQVANILLFARKFLNEMNLKPELILAVNTLFFMENSRQNTLKSAIRKSLECVGNYLLTIPHTVADIKTFHGDARLFHKIVPKKINLIITSPPYINVFNYHQNYRAIMELLN